MRVYEQENHGIAEKQASHAQISEFKRKRPDLTLHSSSPDGPVVGIARYPRSREIKIGLGDNATTAEWLELKKTSSDKRLPFSCWSPTEYDWECNGTAYTLRTKRAVDGQSKSWCKRHLEITARYPHEQEEQLVARFVNTSALKRSGYLELQGDMSGRDEIVMLLCVIAQRHKARRQKNAGAAGAGAGAGAF